MRDSDYFRAGRASTPVETLYELALASCPRVRSRVAENASCSPQLLDLLSRDKEIDVRISVGANAKTPSGTLWTLAFDEHPDVRFSLAENANTALMILIWLADDENPYVAHRALRTIDAVAGSNSVTHSKGDSNMATKTIERVLRRMLSRKKRLNKHDAVQLKKLILEDGYLSRSEKKIIHYAIENDLLEDSAFEMFLELLLDEQARVEPDKAIA